MKCETCKLLDATTIDYRKVCGVTNKYRSCDNCRFLGHDKWMELHEATAKIHERCKDCRHYSNKTICNQVLLPCILVTECEHGKVTVPEWFINEHTINSTK